MKQTVIGVIILVGIIVARATFYIVPEGRQVIITQFGEPIGEPVTDAGLHLKKPFFHKVRYVDKRILSWDGYPNQIPTKDKKYISVDTTARWRVTDALKFIRTVIDERGAKTKLDAILDASTRNVISNQNLVEAVRDTNDIIQKIEEERKAVEKRLKDGEEVIDEQVSGDIESISVGREQLSKLIVESAKNELLKFGIELIDVQLRRISYEKTVERKVYERMISERQRIAQKIRSIGQGEKEIIEGRITKDLKKIESEAYRKAQNIKGTGEAKAFKIYAKKLSQDPEFFEFIRSMEAYKKVLNSNTKLLLSPDAKFFKYIK
jgi:membrane protease subunit HflC